MRCIDDSSQVYPLTGDPVLVVLIQKSQWLLLKLFPLSSVVRSRMRHVFMLHA